MKEKIKFKYGNLNTSTNKNTIHTFCLLEKIRNKENIISKIAQRSKIARKHKNIKPDVKSQLFVYFPYTREKTTRHNHCLSPQEVFFVVQVHKCVLSKGVSLGWGRNSGQ